MEENIRRIAITGVHKVDMVMYCAYILQKMEYQVLVCDATGNHELERCIRKPKKPMEMIRYKNMDFAFSDLVSLDEGYDFIFYVKDFDEFSGIQADKHIFISDGERTHLNGLIGAISRLSWNESFKEADCMIVYRNLYASYGMEYVEERMKRKLRGMFMNYLNHDCMDEACYQRMQFRPFSHLADVSSDMELIVRRMVQFCSGLDEKAVKRGIKLAKRGRAC